MPTLFPRQTVEWKLEEPAAFRRLTLSLVEMAVITGVVIRLLRALVLTRAGPSMWWLGGAFALLAVLLCLAATAHLSNYPVRQWLWRAPAFAAAEALAEMVTSLALIALHREAMGTTRADFADWPRLAAYTIFFRLVVVVGFALALAAVVQAVRYVLLRLEDRAGTVAAVHEEAERVSEEEQAQER